MKTSSVNDCVIIELDKHHSDRKGNLSVVENQKNIPLDIKRVFYIYDVPGGEDRGAHAHKVCHQYLVAVSGSFDVFLDDGFNTKIVPLNRPFMALHILPGIWAAEQNFSSGAVCLVLASEKYDENDYIRNYNEFITWKKI